MIFFFIVSWCKLGQGMPPAYSNLKFHLIFVFSVYISIDRSYCIFNSNKMQRTHHIHSSRIPTENILDGYCNASVRFD